MSPPVLHLVVCGAPLASRALDGIAAARTQGWEPVLVPTAAAMRWLKGMDLTDVAVRRGEPGEASRPPAAVAVVPATFNTLNAWANGNAHSFALTTLCEALGARIPTVAVPFAKHDLTSHPAWLASLAVLRHGGVNLVNPTGGQTSHVDPVASGTGEQIARKFDWAWVLDRL